MSKKEVSASLAGSVSLGGQLSVLRLGYGAMRLTGDGIWGPPKDRKVALAVLRRAVELGLNFIDTADSYGPGVSEELIAEALFPYPKDLVIATKGGWNRPGPNQWTHDASPAHLRNAIEGSLKRLRLDRIEVYQLHAPDPSCLSRRRSRLWLSCKKKERFIWWGYRTSRGNTLSAHARLFPSSRYRTVTVSQIVNGITWSITVSEMNRLHSMVSARSRQGGR